MSSLTYICTLHENSVLPKSVCVEEMDLKLKEKALIELREDDLRKQQALDQFREWISKHPFLKGVRQDDVYLLQFLRVRKFSVDDAFLTLERAYLARKQYPQFFDFGKGSDARIDNLFNTGYCYPLSGRDHEGRKIILMQTRRLNTDIYSVYDAIRLFFYVATVLLEEEETQIAGLVFIFNHDGITLKHIMSPVDVRDFMEFVKNCSPARIKNSYVANLPSFANFMIEIFKSAMSDKLKKRLFILKSSNDLKTEIDPSLLPKAYGGTRTEAEMMQDFVKFRESKRKDIQKIFDFVIDWKKVPGQETRDNVGSFRKLNID